MTDGTSSDRTPSDRTPAFAVDPKLLEILVCPLTKGTLIYHRQKQEIPKARMIEAPQAASAPTAKSWEAA